MIVARGRRLLHAECQRPGRAEESPKAGVAVSSHSWVPRVAPNGWGEVNHRGTHVGSRPMMIQRALRLLAALGSKRGVGGCFQSRTHSKPTWAEILEERLRHERRGDAARCHVCRLRALASRVACFPGPAPSAGPAIPRLAARTPAARPGHAELGDHARHPADRIGKNQYRGAWAAGCASEAQAPVAGACEHAEEAEAVPRTGASATEADGVVGRR